MALPQQNGKHVGGSTDGGGCRDRGGPFVEGPERKFEEASEGKLRLL